MARTEKRKHRVSQPIARGSRSQSSAIYVWGRLGGARRRFTESRRIKMHCLGFLFFFLFVYQPGEKKKRVTLMRSEKGAGRLFLVPLFFVFFFVLRFVFSRALSLHDVWDGAFSFFFVRLRRGGPAAVAVTCQQRGEDDSTRSPSCQGRVNSQVDHTWSLPA